MLDPIVISQLSRTVLESAVSDSRIRAILQSNRNPIPWVSGNAIRFPWDPECARLLGALERCPANPQRRYVDSIIADTVAILAALLTVRDKYPD
jgi:hypothetical protein